jgi:hypothetical protein
VTYRGNNINISVSVPCNRTDEEDGKGGEIILVKPFCASHCELFRHAVLFLR